MELPSQEGEMPIPLNSTYVGGHAHGHGHVPLIHHEHPTHHNHVPPLSAATPQITCSNGPPMRMISSSSNLDHHQDHVPYKKMVKYKECLKNHAASMGGNATDGCGEFMPSGEEGSLEALTCSACNCHRNFHRKEIEGEPSSYDCYNNSYLHRFGRKMIMGHHKSIMGPGPESLGYPTASLVPSRSAPPPPHPMIMSYNVGSLASESDEQEGGGGGIMARPNQMVKKRFRTKFSQEQKEKMFNFAEKIGWKIQKQEEADVQQFCQEIGVRRRVLKVWMHNNKHHMANKNNSILPDQI